jgi:GT2 family glycosyltransferase
MSRTRAAGSPLVSIVIVNFDSKDYLLNCVSSVMHSAYPNKELIIVDNASHDDSVKKTFAVFPNVKVVHNRVNMGYAAGCNIGIASAKGDFIAIMNPDTIVESHWLERLVNAAYRYPHGAFFQPKILLMDDERILNSAGNMIHIAGFGVCRGLGALDTNEFQTESPVCYASGACTLVRREALRAIGPMEELFFAYGEDKDWGWRASMLGWKSMYIPSSRILHKWSSTLGQTPRKFYLLEYERLLSICKNYSRRTLVLLLPVFLMVECWVLFYAAVENWLGEKFQSYVDLLRARNVVYQKRQRVQSTRTVCDRAVIASFVASIEHPYLGPATKVLNRLASHLQALVVNSI